MDLLIKDSELIASLDTIPFNLDLVLQLYNNNYDFTDDQLLQLANELNYLGCDDKLDDILIFIRDRNIKIDSLCEDIITKYHSLNNNVINDAKFTFNMTCFNNHLEVAQWLYTLIKIDYKNAFVISCENGHLRVAQWLYDLIIIDSDEAFVEACQNGHLNVARW